MEIFQKIWIGFLVIFLLFQVFVLGARVESDSNKDDLESYKQSLLEKSDLVVIDDSVYEIKAARIK